MVASAISTVLNRHSWQLNLLQKSLHTYFVLKVDRELHNIIKQVNYNLAFEIILKLEEIT